MNRGLQGFLAGVMCLLLLSTALVGDTLVLKSGKRYEGKLVRRNKDEIVFEIMLYGVKTEKTFPASDVEGVVEGKIKEDKRTVGTASSDDEEDKLLSPEPNAPPVIEYDGPTYYVIPLKGDVGIHILARLLERSLEDAKKRNPDVVVLEVDSPGGMTVEAEKIIKVIRKYNDDLRIVAYVKKALSAAAVLSMACREIYADPGATFGAATAYQMTSFGLPQEISEKMQSAWRATARSAAEAGGHNSLLVEAMIDSSVELYRIEEDGKVVVKKGRNRRGGKQICAKGRILTLTAKELKEINLARDVVDGYKELGTSAEVGTWEECKGHGMLLARHWRDVMDKWTKRQEELARDYHECVQKAREAHPENSKIPYRYYSHSGTLTAESRRRWKKRSRECMVHLRKAENVLAEAVELCEEYEEFEGIVEQIKVLLEDVQDRRQEVARKMNKTTPD